MLYQPIKFSDAEIDQFWQQGFLVLDRLLPSDIAAKIDDRLDPLFATQLETGIYPDEWHGRPGLSQPQATRQMVGMWRCSQPVAVGRNCPPQCDSSRMDGRTLGHG
jgi:phytanoyl-CoA hydroxylase